MGGLLATQAEPSPTRSLVRARGHCLPQDRAIKPMQVGGERSKSSTPPDIVPAARKLFAHVATLLRNFACNRPARPGLALKCRHRQRARTRRRAQCTTRRASRSPSPPRPRYSESTATAASKRCADLPTHPPGGGLPRRGRSMPLRAFLPAVPASGAAPVIGPAGAHAPYDRLARSTPTCRRTPQTLSRGRTTQVCAARWVHKQWHWPARHGSCAIDSSDRRKLGNSETFPQQVRTQSSSSRSSHGCGDRRRSRSARVVQGASQAKLIADRPRARIAARSTFSCGPSCNIERATSARGSRRP